MNLSQDKQKEILKFFKYMYNSRDIIDMLALAALLYVVISKLDLSWIFKLISSVYGYLSEILLLLAYGIISAYIFYRILKWKDLKTAKLILNDKFISVFSQYQDYLLNFYKYTKRLEDLTLEDIAFEDPSNHSDERTYSWYEAGYQPLDAKEDIGVFNNVQSLKSMFGNLEAAIKFLKEFRLLIEPKIQEDIDILSKHSVFTTIRQLEGVNHADAYSLLHTELFSFHKAMLAFFVKVKDYYLADSFDLEK